MAFRNSKIQRGQKTKCVGTKNLLQLYGCPLRLLFRKLCWFKSCDESKLLEHFEKSSTNLFQREDFEIDFSSGSVTCLIETLRQETKLIFREKYEFETWVESLLFALFWSFWRAELWCGKLKWQLPDWMKCYSESYRLTCS